MSEYSRCAACTIVSKNYLAFARTLAASYLRYHPGALFYVLLVDKKGKEEAESSFTLVGVEELGIENFTSVAFKFDILELNTNVKPSFCKYLFRTQPIDKLCYIDPDISFYHAADPIWEELDRAAIVLTPHLLTPAGGELEQDFLRKGVFNLGFIGLRRGGESGAFLDWWEARCLQLGFSEPESGLFVDQKWIDLVPALFSSFSVIPHVGCNMAYWNFHERRLSFSSEGWVVNEKYPLIFFHFSGFSRFETISRSRYPALSDASFRQVMTLYEEYRTRVYAHGHALLKEAPYTWRTFSNGKRISLLARRLYAAQESHFTGKDPFEASGSFYKWAKRCHFLDRSLGIAEPRWMGVGYAFLHRWVGSAFKIGLRLLLRGLGAGRYEKSMTAFLALSLLRNQKSVWKIKK